MENGKSVSRKLYSPDENNGGNMPKEQYLECGKIVGTHGVKGMVRLECYCNTPMTLARMKRLYKKEKNGSFTEYKVLRGSVQKTMVLCALEGVDTLDAAIPLKGTVLYADRADFRLRPDDVFIADMLNLPVIDEETGEQYGILTDVLTAGVQDIYVVTEENGKTFMIPGVAEFIKKRIVEGEDAGIYVKLIEGMREN
ncbi:MAG: 16S rRNA processing protein RimM [Ruminococcaceae bacterium]|nr:16S rRNA processing protein RimM [Oscillospiraceae bacterium]